MKPAPFLLPILLSAPALFPLVSATAENGKSDQLPTSDATSVAVGADSISDAWSTVPPARPLSTVAVQAPPPVNDSGVVRMGDTLIKIAQRYNLTLQDLLRLNPGLETARLVVGTQVRIAQSSPGRSRLLLGLKPVGSGGLSWPDTPTYDQPQRRFQDPSQLRAWIWPAQGLFTSGYGWRWGRMHKGIDIASNVGTPIVAAQAGRVTFAGWHDGGYGFLVELTHDDGSRSIYAHNSRLLVREGERVQQGATISQMGSTGRSTGPHLHFEIHPPGQGAINPLSVLPPRA